jgi:hypothetical protein
MSLLQGPVVFIDDQVLDPSTAAYELAKQISDSGRPIAQYKELPPEGHEEHWRSLAFLVLDWDLVPGSPGGTGGSTLSEFERISLFEWLENFVDRIFCPVFIISAENVDDIERQISENQALQAIVDTGRIKVYSKSVLMDSIVDYLEDWVSKNAALAALNIWANECESATDRLFHDMEKLAPDWPAYVWKSALDDKIDPSYELASVLTANLLHRMNVVEFNITAINELGGSFTPSAMRRVAQGRTALGNESLYAQMILPGDIFQDEDGSTFINVTPSCHTVLGRTADEDGEPDPTKLMLDVVRGRKVDRPTSKSGFNSIDKKYNTSNGMLIHTFLGDDPYAFDFRTREIVSWDKVAQWRVGRLLPPFITSMQQRHAAYLMNEGLPRVDWALYDDGS